MWKSWRSCRFRLREIVRVYDRLPEASRPAFQPAQLLKKQDWLRLQGLEDVSTKHAIANALTAQMAYEIGEHSGLTKHSTNCLSWSSFVEIYPESRKFKIWDEILPSICARSLRCHQYSLRFILLRTILNVRFTENTRWPVVNLYPNLLKSTLFPTTWLILVPSSSSLKSLGLGPVRFNFSLSPPPQRWALGSSIQVRKPSSSSSSLESIGVQVRIRVS